ncbi:Crp/Fnr family transcriptional regulator [soil metagenome]
MTDIELLKRVPLFQGLDDRVLDRLATRCRSRTVEEGQTILYQGDEGAGLFIIVRGRVSIEKSTRSGKTLHIADRGSMEHFGEMSLLDGEPVSADVITREETRLLVLWRKDFEVALAEEPLLSMNVIMSLVKRLREQSDHLSRFAGLDVLGKLCLLLLDLSIAGPIRMTQTALADRIGTTRESVNRSLVQLQDVGAIELVGREIHVTDREYLEERSELD